MTEEPLKATIFFLASIFYTAISPHSFLWPSRHSSSTAASPGYYKWTQPNK